MNPSDAEILAFWQRGYDTAEIAAFFHCKQSYVANRLPAALALRRASQVQARAVR